MRNEFTAVFERDDDCTSRIPRRFLAPTVGRTKEDARASLAQAIALLLQDRREDGLRGVPPDADCETVIVT
jgi:hypothetical protein